MDVDAFGTIYMTNDINFCFHIKSTLRWISWIWKKRCRERWGIRYKHGRRFASASIFSSFFWILLNYHQIWKQNKKKMLNFLCIYVDVYVRKHIQILIWVDCTRIYKQVLIHVGECMCLHLFAYMCVHVCLFVCLVVCLCVGMSLNKFTLVLS